MKRYLINEITSEFVGYEFQFSHEMVSEFPTLELAKEEMHTKAMSNIFYGGHQYIQEQEFKDGDWIDTNYRYYLEGFHYAELFDEDDI